jgi:hypothetical protein
MHSDCQLFICIPLVAGISLTGLTQEKHFHKHKVMVLLFETAKGISEVCNIGGIVAMVNSRSPSLDASGMTRL